MFYLLGNFEIKWDYYLFFFLNRYSGIYFPIFLISYFIIIS